MSRPYRLMQDSRQLLHRYYSLPDKALDGALRQIHWYGGSIEVVNVESGRWVGTYTLTREGHINFNHKRVAKP